MTLSKEKISAETAKEQPFYPDHSEIIWQYIVGTAVVFEVGFLLYIALHASEGKVILFLLFFIALSYISYVGYFMRISPKLYVDEAHTYLHIKSSAKDEIIYLNEIANYDYFYCYRNPLKYPFLCLCVQLYLHNGRKVEFFAFMKGVQGTIENKMSSLGITKKMS